MDRVGVRSGFRVRGTSGPYCDQPNLLSLGLWGRGRGRVRVRARARARVRDRGRVSYHMWGLESKRDKTSLGIRK